MKINLIFDATILENGCDKTSGRSGIYFVAFNILKELAQKDIFNIYLYTRNNSLIRLKKSLKMNLPDYQFKYLTNTLFPSINDLYAKTKNTKNFAKKNNDNISVTWLRLPHILLDCLNKINIMLGVLKIKSLNNFIFLSPQLKVPKQFKKMKRFTILHDTIPMLFPEYFAKYSIDWVTKLINSLNNNEKYFTVSENTKKDFLHFAKNVSPDNIKCTLLAADKSFKKADPILITKTLKKYNIPNNKKYIFNLCTIDPRKNQIRAIKCFIEFIKKHQIDDLVFVMGGAQWAHFIKEMEKSIEDLGLFKDKILKIGYVDDEDLATLYSGAEWFVYTSQYEGFGLPPLEAMSCGCPVITSNNSSLPEVVGDAGIMIDWDSDEQHIQAYEKYYFDQEYKSKMAKKGQERSKQFSWTKCANQMIEEMLK